jgi:hypothetical protein
MLVLALAAMGTGYSYWSRTLNVSGTVNAATLDWQFTPPMFNVDNGNDWNADPSFTNIRQVGYNIGSTVLTHLDSHTVGATVSKAYPDYYDCWSISVLNTSNMPLLIENATLNYDGHDYPMLNGKIVTTLDGVFEFRFQSNIGLIIQPTDVLTESIAFHVLAPVQYGQIYDFTIHVVGTQVH